MVWTTQGFTTFIIPSNGGPGSGRPYIILDGLTGEIRLYDANDNLVERISPDGGYEAFTPSTDSAIAIRQFGDFVGMELWATVLKTANKAAKLLSHINDTDDTTDLSLESGRTTTVDNQRTQLYATWFQLLLLVRNNTDVLNQLSLTANNAYIRKPWQLDGPGGTGGGWTPCGLGSGWGPRSGNYWLSTALAAHDNMVMIAGTAIGGTTTSGTLVATLPAQFRPAGQTGVPLLANNGETYGLTVNTNGQLNISRPAGAAAFTSFTINSSYPLSGLVVPP